MTNTRHAWSCDFPQQWHQFCISAVVTTHSPASPISKPAHIATQCGLANWLTCQAAALANDAGAPGLEVCAPGQEVLGLLDGRDDVGVVHVLC